MSTEPTISRLQLAMAKMDEAEQALKLQAQALEAQAGAGSSPEAKARLAECASAMEAISSARTLLGQLQADGEAPK